MSRRKPSPFQNCETREAFLDALQQAIASGKVTPAVYGAAKMLCKMKGWDTPAETVSVAPEVESPTVATTPGGDGKWRWREDPKSPWSPPLTTEQMVETYNRVAAEGIAAISAAIEAGEPRYKYGRYIMVGVITPKGLSDVICCELPCTVAHLEAINEKPPRDINDPW